MSTLRLVHHCAWFVLSSTLLLGCRDKSSGEETGTSTASASSTDTGTGAGTASQSGAATGPTMKLDDPKLAEKVNTLPQFWQDVHTEMVALAAELKKNPALEPRTGLDMAKKTYSVKRDLYGSSDGFDYLVGWAGNPVKQGACSTDADCPAGHHPDDKATCTETRCSYKDANYPAEAALMCGRRAKACEKETGRAKPLCLLVAGQCSLEAKLGVTIDIGFEAPVPPPMP